MRLMGRTTVVLGLKGTGKSNLVQWLMSLPQYRNHLVYDVCREHGSLNRYVAEYRHGDEARAELDGVTRRLVTRNRRAWRPDLFVVEEASRFCSSQRRPPDAVADLADLARHYAVGLLVVARRPAQIHADLVDLADNVLIFRLTGRNDKRALDAMVDGLSGVVRTLDGYRFVRLTPDRKVMVHDAVPEMDTTGRL